MNMRRLRYFVRVVDIGSVTQAAELLHIAQPALSQQLLTLETEMEQLLLIRTKRGVTPTEAGKVLYTHAQSILRQCEQAKAAVDSIGLSVSGEVSVGLAPATAASALALPLLRRVHERHPGILLYLNENFGTMLSELIMNGRMDMAILYSAREVRGLSFATMMQERFYLVSAAPEFRGRDEISLNEIEEAKMLLPRPYNTVRRLVDAAFAEIGSRAKVIAEVESSTTLAAAIKDQFGSTILPESAARILALTSDISLCRITKPDISAPLALCLSGHLPLSVPAQAVKVILLELVAELRNDILIPQS
ncbi:nitrogen assimilation transcriptional regulator [Pseudomonas gingeri]|uniref:nitrogen assimilation transcriptional regulator NAC n=1 Tax=Pseudomonas gingeri TaxID=117681 RepID=UPI0015A129E4|nr:nitrogen assimilation transcriptional regulator NAC [Pseudomonas gingeri]NWD66908.1 nitrogen assimilation transcriptional regulator [Pseudomonas gingeri]